MAAAAELAGLGGPSSQLWSWEPNFDAQAVVQRVVREQRDALAAIKNITGAQLVALRRHSP